MKTCHRFLITSTAILIFPVLNAQDITGDWYGVCQREDSVHINLHIYKNYRGLKATVDWPDIAANFGLPVDEITLEKDTLFFQISAENITYKGHINRDYSIINGDAIQMDGHKIGLDFGRKKLKRIFPVNKNSLPVIPAKVKVIKARNPQKLPYTGIRAVKAGIQNIIEIDTSQLKVLTPGKGTFKNPMVYKFPEPITQDEYTMHGNSQNAPIIVRVKQTEPIPAQLMRMKDAACYNIQCLGSDQGLIDPDIRFILEDKRGNIWFASNSGGICVYDGISLTYYTTKEGLTNDGVRALIEDSYGNIWIGTDWGLCKYDGKSFTQYTGQLFLGILSLLESRNGDIWIGTQNGLTEKKGNNLIRYTENEGLINNIVKAICEDRYGNLWFGTEKGVSKFDGVSFTHFTENEGLISNYVTSVIEDKCGNIWFGTDLGASKYDGKSFRQFGIKEGLSNIKSITEDNNGYLWFATGGRGVKIYDGESFTTITAKEGLSNNNILFITKDRSRNIWLSPYGSGVVKIKQSSFIYFPQFEDVGKGKVTSIIEDKKGNIWFAFGEGYLAKFDGESFMVITENEDQTHLIYTYMLKDKDGNIWFSNDDGLNKYNGNSVTLYYEKEVPDLSMIGFINCLYEDKKGNIWLGTWGKGLKKFDGKNFTDFCRGIKFSPNEGITSILQDNNEDIWYGTIDGLLKYDGECITKYDITEGLSGFIISSLFGDEAGNLWIGTQDGGVNKFDGNSFTYFTEKEGLSNNNVSSIIGDKRGNIWVGTKKGLSLLSRQEDGDYSITSFRTKDALKVLDFIEGSVCLDSRNRLWWGTGDIVTMLDLNTFELDTKPPVIQLNNIYLNQRYIDFRAIMSGIEEAKKSPSDSLIKGEMRGLKFSDVAPFYNYPVDLKLPHYLNNVKFNFSAIDWTAPQNIRYQYMVEGMDEEWNPLSSENKAEYRNIPSGKYTFKVKAISTANIWSDTFEYPFTVRPPWWFQWWAYTIYIVILVLLVRYYIRYRIGREKIKAEIKIKQVEVDKMQELDQMKSRFFANISHEFRTPLTLILGPVEDFIRKKPKRIEISWDLLKIIHRNARRLHQLIDQLLDLSKLETGKLKLEVTEGDLTGFIRTIVLSFLSLAESKRINYEYDLQDMSATCFYDEDKIEKIITNLISNALKFTPDGGSVMVTLGYSRDKDIALGLYAEISIKDTGPGIPDDEKEKIFDRFYQVSSSDSSNHEGSGIGLALTRELVELYRGEINVESEVGKGSTFKVILPASRKHFREDEIISVSEKPAKVKFIDDHEIHIREAAEPVLQKDLVRESDRDRPIILVVEDHMDLRKYISGNLLRHYQILEAENGREGLDKAIECIPDLVISDLMMPEMDGVEMCDRLKKDTRTNHIPLIMLTAKADRESKLESLETGADDYIIKPFDAEELQVRVKNLIEQRKKLREFYRKEFLADPAVHEVPLPENEFLDRFMDCLKKHLTESGFNVEQLGEELHLSRTQLYRKILALTDHTPGEFIRNFRLKMAARMFLEGHRNITKVLYTVGYNSPSHFTQSFRELFGINPSEYIKQKAKSTN